MPLNIERPDLNFWRLRNIACNNSHGGCEFSIFVSNGFLETAQHRKLNRVKLQRLAREVAKLSNFNVQKNTDLLIFSSFGIQQFNYPNGGGTWLRLELDSICKDGAIYSTHNCDRPGQQSILLAMWLIYADQVEIHAPKSKD